MMADLIVTGTIYTGDKARPMADLMAIKDGKVCFLGDKEDGMRFADSNTQSIDFGDNFIMPSIFEGHAHATSGVIVFQGIDLYERESVEDYMKLIQEYIDAHPQVTYVLGRGFINSHFGVEGPNAKLLDKKYPDKYFYLESEDCHSCWVNQKTLDFVGIDKYTVECKNGVIVRDLDTLEPTGWLKEKEMERVKELFPKSSVEDYKITILKFQELAIKNGLTAVYEPVMNNENDYEKRVEAYYQLDQENKLILDFRVGITIDPAQDSSIIQSISRLRHEKRGTHFQIIGIKLFVDGVVEGHTAYLREPYADAPTDCGYSMWEQEALNLMIREAVLEDLNVHIHAIGDAALDVALDGFEASASIYLQKDMRNCITHLQVVQEDQIRRFKELDIIAVTNPFWHFKNPDYFQELELPFLGEVRANQEYPMKSFVDNQVVVTQASDWPVSHSNYPFLGLEIAHTRREKGNLDMLPLNEKEALSVDMMMPILTINGAYQLKLEESLGSLEVGKRANFIVLNHNPLTTTGNLISEIEVMGNYFEGIDGMKSV